MSDLTEQEILDCLKTNVRSAIEHCELLASLPGRGLTYDAFRKELKLIEGCCRQIAFWREDSRWLQIGFNMEEAHKRAGTWLRRHFPRPLFMKLADNLRLLQKAASDLETKRTGIAGMILPKPQAGPLRQGRPVSVMLPKKSSGGILLPASYEG